MNRTCILLLSLLLPVTSCSLCQPSKTGSAPKNGREETVQVGVVYSAWGGNRYQQEFDDVAARLGWQVTHLENQKVADWIGELPRFQLIVTTSALVDQAPDMTPYRTQWNRWIAAGGTLVVADANYPEVLEKWLCTLGGANVALNARAVTAADAPVNPADLQCDTATGILESPNDVRSYFQGKSEGTWSRFVSWGQEWRSLIGVNSSESYMLMREQGKGVVIAMCYSAFEGEKDKPQAYRWFENILARTAFRNAGLVVKEFAVGPPTLGDQWAHCVLQGAGAAIPPAAAPDYSATLQLWQNGKVVSTGLPVTGRLEGGDLVFRLPYRIDQRGALTLQCVISKSTQRLGVLGRLLEIPLSAVTVQSYNRHPHPGHPLLSFGCQLSPDYGVSLTDCTLRFAIDGVVVSTQAAPAASADYCLPCPGLETGTHSLAVTLLRQNRVLAETGFAFEQTALPVVYYRPDGVFVVRGAPFFPLGWYHVSWATDAADRTTAMRTIGDAGFNWLSASMLDRDFPEGWQTFLRDAQHHGVMVLTETRVEWEKCIPPFRNKTALFGYTALDEPDGHGAYPSQVNDLHEKLKRADPDHLTWATLCAEESLEKYVGLVDISAPDPYPYLTLHDERSRDRLNVFRIVKKTAELAAARGTTCMAVIQCFGGYEIFKVPTFAQIRSMTYQALLAGAKGIAYYTFNDSDLENKIPRFRMMEHPDLWQDMKSLPAEIQALHPALFGGTRFTLEVDLPRNVYVGGWILADKIIVCVINDSNVESQEVDFSLPVPVGGQPQSLFRAYPGRLTLRNGQLGGTVSVMETLVYEIPRQ